MLKKTSKNQYTLETENEIQEIKINNITVCIVKITDLLIIEIYDENIPNDTNTDKKTCIARNVTPLCHQTK